MTVPGAGPSSRRAGPSAVSVLLVVALGFSGGCGGDADSAKKDRTERVGEPAPTTTEHAKGKGKSAEGRSPAKGTPTPKADPDRPPARRRDGERAKPSPGEQTTDGLGYGKEGPGSSPSR